MLLIKCPYCGLRTESEFAWGGEDRSTPENASDAVWSQYLYSRRNLHGASRERWVHAAGCRQWFVAVRNTTDHEIVNTILMNGPEISDGD